MGGTKSDEFGGGFADGFGLLWGFDGLFDDVGKAGGGVVGGFGGDELSAFVVDVFDGFFGGLEGLGVEDG